MFSEIQRGYFAGKIECKFLDEIILRGNPYLVVSDTELKQRLNAILNEEKNSDSSSSSCVSKKCSSCVWQHT